MNVDDFCFGVRHPILSAIHPWLPGFAAIISIIALWLGHRSDYGLIWSWLERPIGYLWSAFLALLLLWSLSSSSCGDHGRIYWLVISGLLLSCLIGVKSANRQSLGMCYMSIISMFAIGGAGVWLEHPEIEVFGKAHLTSLVALLAIAASLVAMTKNLLDLKDRFFLDSPAHSLKVCQRINQPTGP